MTPRGSATCFVCGAEAVHDHHVVPRSVLPNDATVPLCDSCHAKVPGHPASLIRGQSLSWAAREAKRRAVGLQVGGAARLGCRWEGGVVVADIREQEALSMVRELFAKGLTHAAIAERLNAAGYTTRRYAQRRIPWTQRSVASACLRMGLRKRGPYAPRRREAV